MTLAETAAELRAAITEEQMREACFAMDLDAMAAGVNRSRLEVLAARIGLSADATAATLDSYERRAKAMRNAHDIIAAMIEDHGS